MSVFYIELKLGIAKALKGFILNNNKIVWMVAGGVYMFYFHRFSKVFLG